MDGKSLWNTRYQNEAYFYGTEPNSFLEEHWKLLGTPVLSLSEGEGRNAVFLASHGLDVLGVDLSDIGLEKARKLAASRGLRIETQVADLAMYEPATAHYGGVVSIFAHLPSSVRQRLCPLVEQALKPGGVVVMEAYAESQLARDTGGPKNPDMLMTVDKIRAEFPNLEPVLLHETERDVREGEGHTGLASVIQFIGRKAI
ncbi:MAG: class I SAM-dependent methyltransferase [Brachymonas sp.]|nr:class I SAM-dependent methyltransferase [Brachymonas sp.]